MNRVASIGLFTGLVASLVFIGCSSTNGGYSSENQQPVEFADVDAQVAYGVEVYTNSCAKCHGASGEGIDDAPQLVGGGAFADYHTAMDVAVFATQNMPPKESARVKMAERDYWAVLAFALSANGVELSEPVGPHNASSIVLNP